MSEENGSSDSNHIASGTNGGGTTTFLVLETIFEENSDEIDTSDTESLLESSETSSDEVGSVIHISPDLSYDSGSESERDVAVPKKRRKREVTSLLRPRLPSGEEDESTNLSRSSSLLQFESLERALSNEDDLGEECDVVFRTSATHRPFLSDSEPPSMSSFSFDSLESNKPRQRSPIVADSLEEALSSSECSSSSSSDEDAGETYYLNHNKSASFRQSRLRSYRSFDSLVHAVRPSCMNRAKTLSLENELAKSEATSEPVKPLKSSENLSEDSGFGGDNTVKTSPPVDEEQEKVTPDSLLIQEQESCNEVVMFNDQLEETTASTVFVRARTPPTETRINIAPQYSIHRQEFKEGPAADAWCSHGLDSHHLESGWLVDSTRLNSNAPDRDASVDPAENIVPKTNTTAFPCNILNLKKCHLGDPAANEISEFNVHTFPNDTPGSSCDEPGKCSSTVIEANDLQCNSYEHLVLPPRQTCVTSRGHALTTFKPSPVYASDNSSTIADYRPIQNFPRDFVEFTEDLNEVQSKSQTFLHANYADDLSSDSDVEDSSAFYSSAPSLSPRGGIKLTMSLPRNDVCSGESRWLQEASPQQVNPVTSTPLAGSAPNEAWTPYSGTSSPSDWSESVPVEITEEVIHKVQVGGVTVVETPPSRHKNNKFGSFFQRFSFRRNKKQKTPTKNSDENLSIENEAIHSVEQVAAELSNLEQNLQPRRPVQHKSRLLGIVGRKKEAIAHPSGATTVESPARVEGAASEEIDRPPADELDNGRAVHHGYGSAGKKSSSLVNLGTMNVVEIDINVDYPCHVSAADKQGSAGHQLVSQSSAEARAKSMEFLLDEDNKAAVLPPENELRKVSERQLSEHELRVQRSLQRLNIPEWYKNSSHSSATSGFLLKRAGSGGKPGGWPGLSSKTTSLSSLQQHSPALRSKYARESNLTSSPSPVVSPSPQERLSFSYTPFTRWSTSRLNGSSSTSPSGSTRSSFHYRQPYLGWRSQEKLLNSTPTHYRTPAERLAANFVSKPPLPPSVNVQPPLPPQNVSESIKEVTSAIVHYVKEKNLSPARPAELERRSPSPHRGSKTRVWVESSFVGSRPLDSPQTPHIAAAQHNVDTHAYDSPNSGFSSLKQSNGAPVLNTDASPPQHASPIGSPEHGDSILDMTTDTQPSLRHELTQLLENFGNSAPSPTAATIEDVLDSLLGLPSTSRSPSPVISPGGSTSYLNTGATNCRKNSAPAGGTRRHTAELHQEESANDGSGSPPFHMTTRRHSSGGGASVSKSLSTKDDKSPRRVSFELEPLVALNNKEVSLDSMPSEHTVRCKYGKCGRVASLAEARQHFKTCHNCNSHVYCSRECRRLHWEKGHRKACLNGRIGALCRRVVTACKEHPPSLEVLSRIACRGYLSHGRGCVKLFFSSPELAERFTTAVHSAGINESLLPGEPCYVKWSELLPAEMGGEQYRELLRLCKAYNTDTRLVLYVAICVVSEVPSSGAVKWERQLITRCSKLRLHRNATTPKPVTADNITRDMDNPETLILTPVAYSSSDALRRKEVVFSNIQRHLRQRGVSLRKHFPDVFRKLCSYVETGDQFTPVTIYPRDSVTGRHFMCIIMPEPEPDKLQHIPTDSSRVQTIDIGREQDAL